jgi:hypothetical protein
VLLRSTSYWRCVGDGSDRLESLGADSSATDGVAACRGPASLPRPLPLASGCAVAWRASPSAAAYGAHTRAAAPGIAGCAAPDAGRGCAAAPRRPCAVSGVRGRCDISGRSSGAPRALAGTRGVPLAGLRVVCGLRAVCAVPGRSSGCERGVCRSFFRGDIAAEGVAPMGGMALKAGTAWREGGAGAGAWSGAMSSEGSEDRLESASVACEPACRCRWGKRQAGADAASWCSRQAHRATVSK